MATPLELLIAEAHIRECSDEQLLAYCTNIYDGLIENGMLGVGMTIRELCRRFDNRVIRRPHRDN